MRRKVDHAARRHAIVAESLRLFGQQGYPAVNFRMIAQRCRISRTALYAYFKDKREIFNEAIDEATSRIEAKYAEIVHSRHSADAKLRQICITVFAMLFDYRDYRLRRFSSASPPVNARQLAVLTVERLDEGVRIGKARRL